MEPSLLNGDVLLVSKPRTMLERGDLVIVRTPSADGRGWRVKRVVGLPGEQILIEDGLLFIEGVHHPEPYLDGLPADIGTQRKAWAVGSGEYMVLGDNRAHSTDSRHFGPIASESVEGIVVARLWPLGGGRSVLLR